MQALPGYKATILARQKHETSRNLRRLPRPTHRRAELILRVVLHGRRDQRRPDGTGTDAIDADAVFELLVGEAAGEGDNGTFAGGVVKEIRTADVGVNGGAVDDCVARLHVL